VSIFINPDYLGLVSLKPKAVGIGFDPKFY